MQVIQLFDSWAHHLSPAQFDQFSLPYAEQIITRVRAAHPSVPLIFHANGGRALAACLAACLSAYQSPDSCRLHVFLAVEALLECCNKLARTLIFFKHEAITPAHVISARSGTHCGFALMSSGQLPLSHGPDQSSIASSGCHLMQPAWLSGRHRKACADAEGLLCISHRPGLAYRDGRGESGSGSQCDGSREC